MNVDDLRTDKGSWAHNYLMVYERLISTPPERVLEIGSYQGGSLQVWAETWPEAEIHAIEHNPEVVDVPGALHILDAYAPATVEEEWVSPGFDLIIDDGPHTLESQLYTAEVWAQQVRPGGLLVIEDIPSEADLLALAQALPADMRAKSFGVTLGGCGSRYFDPRWSRMLVAYR